MSLVKLFGFTKLILIWQGYKLRLRSALITRHSVARLYGLKVSRSRWAVMLLVTRMIGMLTLPLIETPSNPWVAGWLCALTSASRDNKNRLFCVSPCVQLIFIDHLSLQRITNQYLNLSHDKGTAPLQGLNCTLSSLFFPSNL